MKIFSNYKYVINLYLHQGWQVVITCGDIRNISAMQIFKIEHSDHQKVLFCVNWSPFSRPSLLHGHIYLIPLLILYLLSDNLKMYTVLHIIN